MSILEEISEFLQKGKRKNVRKKTFESCVFFNALSKALYRYYELYTFFLVSYTFISFQSSELYTIFGVEYYAQAKENNKD